MKTGRLLTIPALLLLQHAAFADAKVCKAGALIYGNPTYSGTPKPNPVGQTVRQDPPLLWRGIVLLNGKVYTTSGQEVWGGDPAGAVKRLAGQEQATTAQFTDGPCADARFMNIWGIAAMRDGSLIVADHPAQAILKISDPLGANCKVDYLVGTNKPFSARDMKVPQPADADGPAKDAKIGDPEWPIVDGSGNVYFIDGAASKVKMIANDAAHTVTTVGQLKTQSIEAYRGLTMLDEKLYTIGTTFRTALIVEIDPATKKVRTIKDEGGAGFPPLDSSHSPSLTSIANDGNALLVSGRGYIWRVDPKTGTVTHIAGKGSDIEYPKGYNPAGVYPAKELFLRFRSGDESSNGTSTFMTWSDNAIYWRGKHDGPYVLKISCP